MFCPVCRAGDTKVLDSRVAEEGASIRRRRQCVACEHRFTTFERIEDAPLVVVKSHGGREPFDRGKVIGGLAAATKGRGVSEADLDELVTAVEDTVRLRGSTVTSAEIGIAVLDRLRTLDEVAYLRFASVYKDFDGASDFHRELALLRKSAAAPSTPA